MPCPKQLESEGQKKKACILVTRGRRFFLTDTGTVAGNLAQPESFFVLFFSSVLPEDFSWLRIKVLLYTRHKNC